MVVRCPSVARVHTDNHCCSRPVIASMMMHPRSILKNWSLAIPLISESSCAGCSPGCAAPTRLYSILSNFFLSTRSYRPKRLQTLLQQMQKCRRPQAAHFYDYTDVLSATNMFIHPMTPQNSALYQLVDTVATMICLNPGRCVTNPATHYFVCIFCWCFHLVVFILLLQEVFHLFDFIFCCCRKCFIFRSRQG